MATLNRPDEHIRARAILDALAKAAGVHSGQKLLEHLEQFAPEGMNAVAAAIKAHLPRLDQSVPGAGPGTTMARLENESGEPLEIAGMPKTEVQPDIPPKKNASKDFT